MANVSWNDVREILKQVKAKGKKTVWCVAAPETAVWQWLGTWVIWASKSAL
jgi:ABC-type glycerol-3-phosphate transport system substrate-binding protein